MLEASLVRHPYLYSIKTVPCLGETISSQRSRLPDMDFYNPLQWNPSVKTVWTLPGPSVEDCGDSFYPDISTALDNDHTQTIPIDGDTLAVATREDLPLASSPLPRGTETDNFRPISPKRTAIRKKRKSRAKFPPLPSKTCHVCTKKAKHGPSLTCSNIGKCKKRLCEQCAYEYNLETAKAVFGGEQPMNLWVCMHCSGQPCPMMAQCHFYSKSNAKRSLRRHTAKVSMRDNQQDPNSGYSRKLTPRVAAKDEEDAPWYTRSACS